MIEVCETPQFHTPVAEIRRIFSRRGDLSLEAPGLVTDVNAPRRSATNGIRIRLLITDP